MTQHAGAGTTADREQIDRRRAMKAALGGAAAAAVFTAPRIEGFSTAPDYASAATVPACAGGSTTAANQHTRATNCNTSGLPKCWTTGTGGLGCSSCNTGAVSVGPARTLGGVTVNANITGRAHQNASATDGGKLFVTFAGNTNQSCNITLTGKCYDFFETNSADLAGIGNAALAEGFNGTYTFNGPIKCNSSPTDHASIQVNYSCVCT